MISPTILTASIAALPPIIAVVVSVVRDGLAAPRRSRQIDDAQKLVAFTKAWTEAASSAGIEVPRESRSALRLTLIAAAESVEQVAKDDQWRRLEQAHVAFTGFLLPRWPANRRARGYALVYYYMLLCVLSGIISGLWIVTDERTIPGGTAWLIAGEILAIMAVVPYIRRRAIMLDVSADRLVQPSLRSDEP